MKNLLLIISIFILSSCSSSMVISDSVRSVRTDSLGNITSIDTLNVNYIIKEESRFILDNNIVYVDGEPYAKLKSINYKISDKKEKYEAVFVLEEYVDPSISKDFITYVSELRPHWDVQVQSVFYSGE